MTLISREDAIETVAQQWLFEASAESPYVNDDDIDEYRNLAEGLFEDVPSAEAEWIPCSKRLPEDGIAVLITTENEEVYIDQVITDPYKERYFQSNTAYDNFQVIAWMPLPEPYREDGEV